MLGRCNPKDEHGEVADKIDDYLWMKLSQLIYDDDDSPAQEKLTLFQLQKMLLEEFGMYLFNAQENESCYKLQKVLIEEFDKYGA